MKKSKKKKKKLPWKVKTLKRKSNKNKMVGLNDFKINQINLLIY